MIRNVNDNLETRTHQTLSFTGTGSRSTRGELLDNPHVRPRTVIAPSWAKGRNGFSLENWCKIENALGSIGSSLRLELEMPFLPLFLEIQLFLDLYRGSHRLERCINLRRVLGLANVGPKNPETGGSSIYRGRPRIVP